ncbi:hypothetical protein OOK31_39280 [Streptomyces sp. NBC_00249]|uniref:hypothetical protein n=1 Tax=Streptomyces sp. NBC_00249 TaxID=2975690 RepID=UPI00225B5E4F|nr:hypothetical protein [Streptomyces sp. NBC_00249]MCX5199848.1 hypothetical protein [Streptomyces sp. NBC_00249]
MTTERVDGLPAVVQEPRIPAEISELGTITDPDYADLFTIAAGGGWSAEQWARAVFEDALEPRKGRLVWGGLLGLRLARGRSAESVAGWRITGRGDGWLRMSADGRLISAQLIVLADGERASVATFIGYHNGLAAFGWPRLSGVHRGALPGLLRRAHAILSGRGDGAAG